MRLVAVIFLAFTALFAGSPVAFSAEGEELRNAGINTPQPARGKGGKCVSDTDFMRRNHMDLLKHQRGDTMRHGIRTKRFSLKGCIDCHAVNGADGKPVAVSDPEHFCRTCHDYVGVRVDCFGCHASKPDQGARTGEHVTGKDFGALAAYLQGLKQ